MLVEVSKKGDRRHHNSAGKVANADCNNQSKDKQKSDTSAGRIASFVETSGIA
jgi:hypothetical protein